jgi:hypothetical protein
MPDIDELLAAEAVRLQPAHQPPFADLLRARAGRRRRTRSIAVAAMALMAGAGAISALPGRDPGRPDDVVRAPIGPLPETVTVTGSLQRIGGPLGTPPRPIPGIVRFQADDGTITATTTTEDGRFTITITVGRYVVTGTPDTGAPCQAEAPVIVPATGLDGVEVNCHIR